MHPLAFGHDLFKRFPRAAHAGRPTLLLAVLSLGILSAATPEGKKKFYNDDPLWAMPRPVAVVNPAYRKLDEYYDFFENT